MRVLEGAHADPDPDPIPMGDDDDEPEEYSGPKLITKPMPMWEEDGYPSEAAYRKEVVDLVEDLFKESREYYERQKAQWTGADKIINLEHILDVMLDKHPSKTRMPYIPQAIEEWLAVRHGDNLRPSASSRQQAYDQQVAAGNYIMNQELDANLWNLLRMRIGIDQLKFGAGFAKVTVDRFAKGVFGQPGEHRIERIDPRYVWPDRFATSWRWRDMKYLIIATPMDLSDICKLWPDRGHLVQPDSRFSLDRSDENSTSTAGSKYQVQSVAGKDSEYHVGSRKRALVLECYLRDGRMRRVPSKIDVDGNPHVAPDGSIPSEMQERFPNGRLIICANGTFLRDTSNPWNHGLPPIVHFPESVSDGLFSYSRIELLDLVDRKLNLLFRETYDNFRVHANSQWVVDRNTFTKPSQYEEITQKPNNVFVCRPNSRIVRLPPAPLPPETFQMFEYIKDTFDQVLGVTKIDRGQLEKGSQMSAESVIQLQGASGQRQQLKKQLDREAVKQTGYLLFSNIRQFYPKQMTLTVKNPATQEDQQLTWDNRNGVNDWDVKMEAGDTAGAEATAQQRAVTLYDKGIIDGVEVLRVLNWSNASEVIARQRDERTRLARLGFVKEALKEGVVSSAMSQNPGRKSMQQGGI